MIESFADKRTAAIFQGLEVRGLPREIQDAARRKLKVIDAALDLGALRVPPENRLEALKGDRKGGGVSASTLNGESAFAGKIAWRWMLRSLTITERRGNLWRVRK